MLAHYPSFLGHLWIMSVMLLVVGLTFRLVPNLCRGFVEYCYAVFAVKLQKALVEEEYSPDPQLAWGGALQFCTTI